MLPCVSACFAQSNLLYSTLCSNKAQAEYSHQRHCTLQRAAVYCSMLQCDEVCYSMRKCGVLQLTTPPLAQTRHRQNTGANAIACCIVMQCVIVCCSVLQCATSWCIATQPLQHLLEHGTGKMLAPMPLHIAVRCSVLQCVAVCCSVLQCVAVCCSVLQCAAVCNSMAYCDSPTPTLAQIRRRQDAGASPRGRCAWFQRASATRFPRRAAPPSIISNGRRLLRRESAHLHDSEKNIHIYIY